MKIYDVSLYLPGNEDAVKSIRLEIPDGAEEKEEDKKIDEAINELGKSHGGLFFIDIEHQGDA